jgi:hypothetical protein
MSQPKAKEIAFVEDIFIVQGQDIYRLEEDTWKARPALDEDDIRNREVANLMPLIRNEAVIAHVPALAGNEEFLFINLTALAVNKD